MILPLCTRFHDPELNLEYDIFYEFYNYFIIPSSDKGELINEILPTLCFPGARKSCSIRFA